MRVLAIACFDGESIPNTYGIFDKGETGAASPYIHACELCLLFTQGPHTGLAPSHLVFLALQTLHAMLILRRFGLGPL